LGSAVTLGVSDGKGEPVVIPRLTGLTQAEAVHRLERLELVAAVERVPVDDRHLDGIVVDQSPIGDGSKVVEVGSTVTIDVGAFDKGNGNGDGTGEGGNGNGNGNGNGDKDGGDASPSRLSEGSVRRAI
jgi:beta-lactam-binding protein with PASTA domain